MSDQSGSISKDNWFFALQRLSKPFRKYGSFLSEQYKLLEEIYKKLQKSKKPVWIFTAPPASGKTHIICLLARILSDSTYETAIVVPNNYLKEEFQESRCEINGGLPKVDLLNLSEYLKTDKQYDFVLVDEAHNLKSFLELETRIVKTLDITKKDEVYPALLSRYLPLGKEFVAQQLSFSSTMDLLKMFKRTPSFRKKLRSIYEEPSSWMCFIYVWKNLGLCSLKFVHAPGLCRLKLPRRRLLLFTATPLSNEELEFYCGIPNDSIERVEVIESSSTWRKKQKICISIRENLSFDEKIAFIKDLIHNLETRTLILFNNAATCQKAFRALHTDTARVFLILSYYQDKSGILRAFLKDDRGILLTSSTIFWEGITIRNLRLLLITDPPFPRPRLRELLGRKITDGRIDMSRRLQQGLGRVGRRRGEFGIVVTLFDPSIANRKIVPNKFKKMKTDECLSTLHRILEPITRQRAKTV